MHRRCGLSQQRLDVAPPTRPQCASFLKDHKMAFASPLQEKWNRDTSLLVIFTSPERWTGSVFLLQQVGISDNLN